MASVFLRGKTWWVKYFVGGCAVSKSLKTTNERIARERKKQLEALDLVGQLRRPSKIPLDAVLQSFCEYLLATRTKKSAKNDISYLRT